MQLSRVMEVDGKMRICYSEKVGCYYSTHTKIASGEYHYYIYILSHNFMQMKFA